MSLVENFLQRVSSYSSQHKVYFEDQEYSYNQIVAKSYDLARLLESYKYKKAFFNLKNSPLTICLYLASWIAEIELVVPINPRLIDKELEGILESNSLFLTDKKSFELTEFYQKNNIEVLIIDDEIMFLENIPKTTDFEIFNKAVIAHVSSGTTGSYKKHLHTIDQIIKYANNRANDLGLIKVNDHLLIALSMNHAFAFSYQLLPALAMGLDITIIREFNPQKVAKVVSECKATALALLPTMYYFLIKENITKHKLRSLSVAGDLASEKLHKAVKQKLGLPLLNGIGMTEIFGYGQNFCENIRINVVKIFEDTAVKIEKFEGYTYGKIFIKSFMLPINNKEEWLKTGDIGSFDEQTKELTFYGRYKDIIIKGGSNISPVELENIILKLASIKSCVVVGKKDKIWGELVCAIIVSESKISLEELNKHLLKYLAEYKKVDMLLNFDQIPLTNTGKVDRKKIRQIIEND
ncbi:acyl-CoA synthetase (AMP-forming)/AMP-acid ligase II [Allofrancisella inopinata]|uniref:Long-chain fatty acid--CoA ligase n=1 Tax=Allofrancisella inopinata TaxID=1085647 RepID=A0AAE6YJV7_9GAMM|nr:class I adenylate-forming enzyme family protein [Allofrancisella inopinata]QIV96087.1 long-chain fatty acid--CoA ligase [Allofrancisella inopinata]TDT69677.1 acyl-CoA synthetase (AMP-forming)/AMP-acid ligase II [Allofrancisella inopinata]